MTTAECRKKAKLVLKGKYGEGFFIVMIFLTVYVIFKVTDIAKIGVLLYNDVQTTELFKTDSLQGIIVKYVGGIIAFAIMTPLITGGLWWFYQTAMGSDNKSIMKLYTGVRLNIRALFLYGIMWVIMTVSLIPTGTCWAASQYVAAMTSETKNQAAVLFIALQLFMLGVFLLSVYLKCLASFILAPFLFIRNPDKNAFKILNAARKKIYGSKLEFIKLVLTYIPAMLPIVTVPFVLPKALMSISVFACDRIGDEIWEN